MGQGHLNPTKRPIHFTLHCCCCCCFFFNFPCKKELKKTHPLSKLFWRWQWKHTHQQTQTKYEPTFSLKLAKLATRSIFSLFSKFSSFRIVYIYHYICLFIYVKLTTINLLICGFSSFLHYIYVCDWRKNRTRNRLKSHQLGCSIQLNAKNLGMNMSKIADLLG